MPESTVYDVAVVGGGIVGLSIAYCCAKAGLRVVVLDEGDDHRKASWATAGIIGAQPFEQAKTPFTRLLGLGGKLHAIWAQELRELTGIDVGYRRCGLIEFARDETEAHALRSAAGHYRAHGIDWQELSPQRLAELEPAVQHDYVSAYLVPATAQARPPAVLAALRVACSMLGATFFTPSGTVVGFLVHGERVDGVVTVTGPVYAEATVVAAGAWSGPLLSRLGLRFDTEPVRGQVCLLAGPVGLVRHILMVGRRYIVPRFDGLYLVGSTQERVGYDGSVTAHGVGHLLAFACALCPPLADAKLHRTWAGLRPGNPDGKPFIGPVPGYERLFIAAGHLRSGFVTGPATGLVMKQLIVGEEPEVPLWPFRPDRPVTAATLDDDEDS